MDFSKFKKVMSRFKTCLIATVLVASISVPGYACERNVRSYYQNQNSYNSIKRLEHFFDFGKMFFEKFNFRRYKWPTYDQWYNRYTQKQNETSSPTPYPIATDTPLPSPTITIAPTTSPTATNTPKPSPTITIAPTTSSTATNTPKPSPTITIAPTPSPTATNTPKPSPTITIAPTTSSTTTNTPKPSPTITIVPTLSPTATNTPKPSPTPSSISADEKALLDLVNQARIDENLNPLEYDADLAYVATMKAKDMIDNKYFSHTSPTYGSPFDMMKSFDIKYRYAGENIAAGYTNIQDVFNGWMNSPGHKANILNENFTHCGFGILDGGTYGGKTWVQMFIGKP